MAWKRIQNRRIGNNISIIYKKDNLTLELFRDALWYNDKNMNVIIRDKKIETLESSLGKSILVKHYETEEKAKEFAKSYMRVH